MSVQPGSGRPASRRQPGSAGSFGEQPWVPVASLPLLARALLSEDLGGREEVPRHVAQRVTAEAERWSAHGFTTVEQVRTWADLSPDAAAYLVRRGVSPRVLDLPTRVARSSVPLRLAIATGVLPIERVYELLVATGEHRPEGTPAPGAAVPVGDTGSDAARVSHAVTAAGEGFPVPGTGKSPSRPVGEPSIPAWSGPREEQPVRRPVAGRPVAPVVFSHATGRRPQPVDG